MTAVTVEEGGRDGLKDGEGINQRTYMNDPWTWTLVWGLTVAVGRWGKLSGKIGTAVIA